MYNQDTIVALATPRENGALGIIRVSGSNAITCIKSRIKQSEKFQSAQKNKIHLYTIFGEENNEIIDEITAIKYYAPNSYTGEDMVEIICHGGKIIIDRILETILNSGARYAERGEFTRRAFYNGKTNLSKAESMNLLVKSNTIIQQKRAINCYVGGCEYKLAIWKEKIEEIIRDIEADIEFSNENDIKERDIKKIIREKTNAIKREMEEELKKSEILKELENGITIALIGPTNAGKSSLMNMIVGYERSIVDELHGTTRDFVSEKKRIGDIIVTFVDTAGLRDNAKQIEIKGIERSKSFLNTSNIIMWITEAGEKIKKEELKIIEKKRQRVLGVINKIDINIGKEKEELFKTLKIPYIKISAINKEFYKEVEDLITKELKEMYCGIEYDTIITSKRQEEILKAIKKELKEIEDKNDEPECIAEHLKEIMKRFEEFIGKRTTDEMIERIFDEFCIGK